MELNNRFKSTLIKFRGNVRDGKISLTTKK